MWHRYAAGRYIHNRSRVCVIKYDFEFWRLQFPPKALVKLAKCYT